MKPLFSSHTFIYIYIKNSLAISFLTLQQLQKHFQPFFLLVLVLASFPALKGSRRTLQAIAPGSSPEPGPILPPPPTSGGGGGASEGGNGLLD